MASTSTNKQPLLIDRVFNNLVKTDALASGSATEVNITGTNASTVLIDCINANRDGGLVEDLWAINRVNQSATQTLLFYLSTAADYLRQDQAVYVGSITIPSSTDVGAYVAVSALPKVLAPVPQVGNDLA